MSFTVKNSELTNDAVSMMNELMDTDINASAAFKLSRILKSISSIVEDKAKVEKKIYNRYIQKDENGKPVHPKDKEGNEIKESVSITDMEGFTKEMQELMSLENEIPYDKIDFEALGMKTAKIKDIIKLDFLFA